MRFRFARIAVAVALITASVLLNAQTPARPSPPPSYDTKDSTVQFSSAAAPPTSLLTLWYRRPAQEWVEALPVGNGRLGAMVFGGINREILQLNEDTLWAGGPHDYSDPDALAALPIVRKMVFDGQYKQAEDYINAHMLGSPSREMPYQPLGDLILDLPQASAISGYRRDLDLDSAITTTAYTIGDVTFRREVFISPVDQVLAVRLTSSKNGRLTFTLHFQTEQLATAGAANSAITVTGHNVEMRGIPSALTFSARLQVVNDGGNISASGDSLTVSAADSVTIYVAAATSYKTYNDASGDPASLTQTAITAAVSRGFDSLRSRHIAEHQRLFRRVSIDLGHSGASAQLPTDERIANFATGNDPQFAALYFQFGRYLLISSSRPGSQPANLQGIWNDRIYPPWEGSYTVNINTEMNYWPAESTNLAETVEPLVHMVLDLTHTGALVAKNDYGARGWVTHHNTDLWRDAAPADQARSGMWPTGGAWLCLHLWDHYEYSGDRRILEQIYPALKGASEFFLDTLVEEPKHHWLVTNPSLSPENRHPYGSSIVDGPTMDEEILRDLFSNTIHAAELLGVDTGLRKQLAATRARLAPLQIGKAGQLQEWLEDWDMQAPEIHHRHVSHLYGLYPSWQIDSRDTPELASAAKKSLEIRGDEATGWGLAWRLNLWARLHDGDHAYKILTLLLRPDRTYPNIFDAHPPFQIDGNFGGTAGITEMLLQSHADELEFLPALPSAWPNGSVSGLRARGAIEVDLQWKAEKLVSATLHASLDRSVLLRYGSATRKVSLKAGKQYRWTP